MEGHDIISSLQFAALFVDWTDPQKIAILPDVEQKDIHIDFAIDLLKAFYDKKRSGMFFSSHYSKSS